MTESFKRSQEDVLRMVDNMLQRAAGLESPAEAEAMAAKAQQLMTKYAIDEAVLAAARLAAGQTDEAPKVVAVKIPFEGIFRKDLAALVHYLAEVNTCRSIYVDLERSKPHQRVVTVVGLEADVKRIAELNTLLGIQRQRALNAFMTATYGGVRLEKMRAFKIRREFIHAYAQGVWAKLDAARKTAQQTAETEHGSTSVALALRSKDDVVAAAFSELFPEVRTVKRRVSSGGVEARRAGFDAGRSADVGQTRVSTGDRRALNR